jgi:hypothetical protein
MISKGIPLSLRSLGMTRRANAHSEWQQDGVVGQGLPVPTIGGIYQGKLQPAITMLSIPVSASGACPRPYVAFIWIGFVPS